MNNNQIDVSVIMLAYNHENYIAEAIESVLAQKFSGNIEIIIGEDCSTDNTRSILEMYAKREPERIVPILREKNVGATNNLYQVFMKARGKYLAILECDDFWTDVQKLQMQYDYLENNPDVVAVYHKIICVDQLGNITDKDYEVFTKSEYTFHDYECGQFPSQGGSCVCRNIFLDRSKDYSLLYKAHHLIGDRTLVLFLLEQGLIHILPNRMGAYRKILSTSAENACSMQLKRNMFLEQWKYYSMLAQYAQEKQIPVDMGCLLQLSYVQAVERFLKTRKWNDLKIANKILSLCGFRVKYLSFFVQIMLEQISRRITGKKRTVYELYFGDVSEKDV